MSQKMRVVMFTPPKLYGFCSLPDTEDRVFFHAGVFEGHQGPPPLVGEEVLVDVADISPQEQKAPKASRVVRLQEPVHLSGRVLTFNPDSGWGFIDASDGGSYYLHRSEVLDGRLPLPGQSVDFYAGSKQGRPRACYVRVR